MIVDGNAIKDTVVEELKKLAAQQSKQVCFVQYGDDQASTTFVALKMRLAKKLGITAVAKRYGSISTEEAIATIQRITEEGYNGIVVQLPLPAGMDSGAVINAIPQALDIDVLGKAALEAFSVGQSMRMPPVAAAIQEIFHTYNVPLEGKYIVIRGKGKLVGEPVAMLFDSMHIPYIVTDSTTPIEQQQKALREADIIISGTGMPHSLTAEMIKDGAVLIDAGTSEHPSNTSEQGSGKLMGDIAPECADKASLYTPVPGGVGPITVACLFKNLFL